MKSELEAEGIGRGEETVCLVFSDMVGILAPIGGEVEARSKKVSERVKEWGVPCVEVDQ